MDSNLPSDGVTIKIFNGASSQSIYNQRFNDTDLTTGVQNEHSVFRTAIVPLKLKVKDSNIWNNPKPSSPYFSRSLELQYQKETNELKC